jgi:hypothetical protein
VLAFAFGLRRTLHPGKGSTWGPVLLGVCGLGLIGAAIFKTDPAFGYPPGAPTASTLHGAVHLLMSNLSIISVVAACIVLAWRFRETRGWRGWAVYSIATAVLVLVFAFVAMLVTSPGPGSLFGLFQRLSLFTALVWIAMVAIRLLGREVPTAP